MSIANAINATNRVSTGEASAGAAVHPDEDRLAWAKFASQWVRQTLAEQKRDGSDQDGGFDHEYPGYCDGRETAYRLGRMMACLCWREALDVDRRQLAEAIRRAARFVAARQAPDGRLDMIGIYAANEAGFPVPDLVDGYERLSAADPALFAEIAPLLKQIITRAAEAVLAGQAHTANHRWAAACAPLAAAHSLWPDPRYLERIESYLADGIDCDEDGFWYEERSPNYNMVANAGLMVMARRLNRPELLQPVLRNLEFILHMIQPNGEMDASLSHRQDRAAADRPPCSYWIARRCAQMTGDGRLTTLARQALARKFGLNWEISRALYDLDDFPQSMPAAEPLPVEYEKHFRGRCVARVRRGSTALTVSADPGGHFYCDVRDQWGGVRYSDDWFHLHHGDIVLQSIHAVAAGAYAVQPRTLERQSDGRYRLAGEARGWTHTLHFRPDSPPCEMRTDLSHQIDLGWSDSTISLDLLLQAPHALIGGVNFWLRPGVEIDEGDSPRLIQAGEVIDLRGGRPLTIRSKTRMLRILGVPDSRHLARLRPAQPIPSVMPKECAVLCLGLRTPIQLQMKLELS